MWAQPWKFWGQVRVTLVIAQFVRSQIWPLQCNWTKQCLVMGSQECSLCCAPFWVLPSQGLAHRLLPDWDIRREDWTKRTMCQACPSAISVSKRAQEGSWAKAEHLWTRFTVAQRHIFLLCFLPSFIFSAGNGEHCSSELCLGTGSLHFTYRFLTMSYSQTHTLPIFLVS